MILPIVCDSIRMWQRFYEKFSKLKRNSSGKVSMTNLFLWLFVGWFIALKVNETEKSKLCSVGYQNLIIAPLCFTELNDLSVTFIFLWYFLWVFIFKFSSCLNKAVFNYLLPHRTFMNIYVTSNLNFAKSFFIFNALQHVVHIGIALFDGKIWKNWIFCKS
jgi:hypothetical protein